VDLEQCCFNSVVNDAVSSFNAILHLRFTQTTATLPTSQSSDSVREARERKDEVEKLTVELATSWRQTQDSAIENGEHADGGPSSLPRGFFAFNTVSHTVV